MVMEVEQKFPVSGFDKIETELAALGTAATEVRTEADLYFAHPARDYASTDEALRIRHADGGDYLTYKGPKIDATTKTRREIELPLGCEEAHSAAWRDLLESLGFRAVAEVRKRRRKAWVPWEGRSVEVSLDEVEEVGTFVELELVSEMPEVESARECIASLAARLGLSKSERRSYLELLLERRSRAVEEMGTGYE